MKWFKNLKIWAKILICFSIITLGLIASEAFSIISIRNVGEADSQLYNKNLIGVEIMGNIQDQYYSLQVNTLRAVHENFGPDGSKVLSGLLDNTSAEIVKLMGEYWKTMSDAEDQNNLNTLKPYIADYEAEVSKIVTSMKIGDIDGTLNEMKGVASSAAKVGGQIDVIMKWNEAQAQKKMEANQAAASLSTTLNIAISVFMLLLEMALCILLTRGIAKPISYLSGIAKKIAAGDLELKKTSFSQKDEVGEMYDSLRSIFDSIKKLTADAELLTRSAMSGDLSVRVDTEQHQGEYRKIVEGVNGTLDAIVGPIQEAMNVIGEMSHGSLEYTIKGDYQGDFASFKEALNFTVGKLKDIVGEISFTLGEVSKGNFDIEITSEYRGNFVTIKDSINEIIESLNRTMKDIGTAADQVTSGARQVSDGAQETSQGATEQASSIEELTASITQIAEQTKQNAMSANKANDLTVAAVSDAAKGNEQMKAMQQAMDEISESSRNISKIIKVIDDIAFQTNILALNAAVEAARAGAHGKGFAVVAEEVRNLAARSAHAASETNDLIEGSIKKTEAGMKIAGSTAKALSSIVEGVDKAAQLVSEIARASGQQASAIAQVNSGIEQMSRIVQTNSATAEEGAAASEELSGQAELLKNMVEKFHIKGEVEPVKGVTRVPQTRAAEQVPDPKVPAIKISDDDFGKY